MQRETLGPGAVGQGAHVLTAWRMWGLLVLVRSTPASLLRLAASASAWACAIHSSNVTFVRMSFPLTPHLRYGPHYRVLDDGQATRRGLLRRLPPTLLMLLLLLLLLVNFVQYRSGDRLPSALSR